MLKWRDGERGTCPTDIGFWSTFIMYTQIGFEMNSNETSNKIRCILSVLQLFVVNVSISIGINCTFEKLKFIVEVLKLLCLFLNSEFELLPTGIIHSFISDFNEHSENLCKFEYGSDIVFILYSV